MAQSLLTLALLLVPALSAAGDKGICPPGPAPFWGWPTALTNATQAPVRPYVQYAGTVSVVAVLSNTGHVCSTRVVRGFDEQINKQAEKAVRQWLFMPPTGFVIRTRVITIDLTYWKNSKGELVGEIAPANYLTSRREWDPVIWNHY